MMNKPFLAFSALVLSACAFVAVPQAREAFYESKCERAGGTALWLASSSDDNRPDGWTKPFCRVDGTTVSM